MKKKKGMLLGILVTLAVFGVIVAAVMIYRSRNTDPVKVYSVGEMLNQSEYFADESGTELSGTIYSDSVQNVNLNADMEVKKIYVKTGDKVKKGDTLLQYNMEEQELDAKLKELQIQSAEAKLSENKKNLEKLKKGDTSVMDSVDSDIDDSTDSSIDTDEEEDTDEEAGSASLESLPSSTSLTASLTGLFSIDVAAQGTEEPATTEDTESTTESATESTTESTSEPVTGSTTETPTTEATEATTTEKKEETIITVSNEVTWDYFTKAIAGKNTESTKASPYVINLITSDNAGSGKISGKVLNYILDQKDPKLYVIFREFTSKQNVKNGKESSLLVVSSDVTKKKEVDDDTTYTISDLLKTYIDMGSLSITCKTGSALKKVQKGKTYTYQAEIGGITVTDYATWTLSGNKSKYTTLSDGKLIVYESESAKKLTIKAAFGDAGKTLKVTPYKSKKKDSSATTEKKSTGSDSTASDSGNSGDSGDPGSDASDGGSYTKEDIQAAIQSLEDEIATGETDLAEDKIEYKEQQAQLEKGTVKAKISGQVTKASTLSDLPAEGESAVTVKSSEDMYVRTAVNELDLDKVKVGGTILCTSYETGDSYEAEIVTVSDYPQSSDGSMEDMGQNPNSSLYPVTAIIEDAEGLSVGDSVTVTYNEVSMGTLSEDAIVVNSGFVRTEDNKSYVYKRGENNRLVKQYVQTRQTSSSEYLQIASGVTEEDYLAFPYGSNVKDGAKTTVSENYEDMPVY